MQAKILARVLAVWVGWSWVGLLWSGAIKSQALQSDAVERVYKLTFRSSLLPKLEVIQKSFTCLLAVSFAVIRGHFGHSPTCGNSCSQHVAETRARLSLDDSYLGAS